MIFVIVLTLPSPYLCAISHTIRDLLFQLWNPSERLLAVDELIDVCEPTQVRHMMAVIEPQFQRDFISLLPKEVCLLPSFYIPCHRASIPTGLYIPTSKGGKSSPSFYIPCHRASVLRRLHLPTTKEGGFSSLIESQFQLPEFVSFVVFFSPRWIFHESTSMDRPVYCHSPVLAVKNVDVRQPILLHVSSDGVHV